MTAARIGLSPFSVYDYTLKHRLVSQNGNANFFSRYFAENIAKTVYELRTMYYQLNSLIATSNLNRPQLSFATWFWYISKVIEYVHTEWPGRVPEQFKP